MSKLVRWTEAERTLVINKIVDLLESGSHTYIGRAAVEAQQVLPITRRRIEISLQQNATMAFGKIINKEMETRSINRYLAKQIEKEKAKEEIPLESQSVSTIEVVESLGQESIISLAMDSLVNSVVEEFKKKLRISLKSASTDLLQEFSTKFSQGTFPSLNGSTEVSAFSTMVKDSKEIKVDKIKIAILGGDGKGSDRQFITRGLEDIYDFRFIDSKTSVGDNIKNCDLVLIRTKFCSHGQQYSAEKVIEKSKIIKFSRSGPDSINALLKERIRPTQVTSLN